MDNSKKLKKGDVLIKENDPIEQIYLIKSGRVTLFIERSGRKLELGQLATGQIIGEKSIFGVAKMPYSVMAGNDVTYIDMPAKIVKDHFEKQDAMTKVITKGVVDSITETRKAIQSIKMESDSAPCGQRMIPKVCATIYMTSNQVGSKKDDHMLVAWNTLKLYANRIFLEPHSRIQGFIEILTKLKYTEMIFTKNEEGVEELTDIKFFNLKIVEDFADFYQYQYYKPGKSEVIYVDKMAIKVTDALVKISEGSEVDHKGATNLEYDVVVKEFKEKFHIDIKTNHWDLLEKKGLFATKRNRSDKIYLQFDREEFKKTVLFWQLIHEVDKWNERGFVLMVEKEEDHKKGQAEASQICPSCSGPVMDVHKFCPGCGSKVAA